MARNTVASNYAAIEALRADLKSKDERISELEKAIIRIEKGNAARDIHPATKALATETRVDKGTRCGNCSSPKHPKYHANATEVKACYNARYATQS